MYANVCVHLKSLASAMWLGVLYADISDTSDDNNAGNNDTMTQLL